MLRSLAHRQDHRRASDDDAQSKPERAALL